MKTVRDDAVTRRRRSRRETSTSPASPAADSRPVETTVAMPRATMRSSHVGVVPRSIELVSASASNSSAMPSTMMSSWIPTSATTSSRIREERVVENPRMLRAAT